MTKNKLAIIVPYFKLEFFQKTLNSLALQTNQEFNVYIGNDASPENPEKLLEKFDGQFNFIYKIFEDNVGSISLTKQWDRCLSMMRDEKWFMILGDDDYLSDNVIAAFYEKLNILEKEFINVVKLNSAVIDENNTIQLQKKTEPLLKSSISHFFDKYLYEGRSSLSEHIFRKSQYNRHGFLEMPFAWHSDDLAILEFSEYEKILFLENAKCFVRVSTESISGNPDKYKIQKWEASKIFFDQICKKLGKFTTEEKKMLFDIIQWHEKEKNIEIQIPNKIYEFYRCYGFKMATKILLSK